MTNLENKIEAILFFKNEPISIKELATLLNEEVETVEQGVLHLQESYKDRGIVLVTDGELVCFGTHPDHGALMEEIQREEFSRELGRAGLETLAIILYKAPVSRREVDYIRGVNSTFILRSLLIRGLIERVDPSALPGAGRSYVYKPTLKLFEHLGITRPEDLPEFGAAFEKMEEFVRSAPQEEREEND